LTSTLGKTRPIAPEDSPTLDALTTAKRAVDAALAKKALEPILLDVRQHCSYADYILLLSGRSSRQVDAIAEGIRIDLRNSGRTPLGAEGARCGQWGLLDYGDVVIHVFHHPIRDHYNLESLWTDAPRVEIDIPEAARVTTDDAYVSDLDS